METLKSHIQQLLIIVNETLVDAYAALEAVTPNYPLLVNNQDVERDLQYIRDRTDHEGIEFLTITLPRLGEFLDSVVQGKPDKDLMLGFQPYFKPSMRVVVSVPGGETTRSSVKCPLSFPCFLRPFWLYYQYVSWDQAIPSDVEGYPIPEHTMIESAAQATLYRTLRTLLFGLKKLDVPSSDELIADKLDSFLEIEAELADLFLPSRSRALQNAQRIMEIFCKGYEPQCRRPHHGPGAVAGGERYSQKWTFDVLYESVHSQWPYYDFLFGVRSTPPSEVGVPPDGRLRPIHLAAEAASYRAMRREKFPVARMVMVPKDSRGPRIICAEPKELMYLQQGVADHLVRFIERHPFTKGRVNFRDQKVNAELARSASRSRLLSTIDLKDASDRVSVQLVKYLFPKEVSKMLLALRSAAVTLPNGDVLQDLKKFAPMGSALCFPVESLIFWSLAVGAAWVRLGDLRSALQSVWVYGDDIVISDALTPLTDAVIAALEEVGLVVNRNKSYQGEVAFRESCGIEAFNGFDVTPLRIKKLPPRQPSDGTGIVAWCKYSENSLYVTPNRSAACLKVVEDIVGEIPRVPYPQSFLSIVDPWNSWTAEQYTSLKWDPARCLCSAKLWRIKNRTFKDAPNGWSRLLRNLNERFADRDPSDVVERSSTQISRKRCFISYSL